jgi:hypothetical protein
MSSSHRVRAAIAATAFATALPAIALAQTLNVTLNGSPVPLSPPPVTRDGRVFVPLRGIFEQLGASVVYTNGTINAQGNGHSIQLHIGSNQALVDGNGQQIDVPPFLIGASTYVPLRFVSQALGAQVNYDAGNRLVALSNGNGPPNEVVTPEPRRFATAPPPNRPLRSPLTLGTVRPDRNQAVDSRRPTIEALFGDTQADPNSVRVLIDGLDVTNQSSRSPNGIVFSPPSDLQSGEHTVQVTGRDMNARPFDRSWRFSSGTAAVTNFINDLQPADNATVASNLTVTGRTSPNARVVVQVGTTGEQQTSVNEAIGQILGISTGGSRPNNVRMETTADANGSFSAQVNIGAASGQHLALVVDSTEPRTQGAARIRRSLTVR